MNKKKKFTDEELLAYYLPRCTDSSLSEGRNMWAKKRVYQLRKKINNKTKFKGDGLFT